jgi:hypothetical protein
MVKNHEAIFRQSDRSVRAPLEVAELDFERVAGESRSTMVPTCPRRSPFPGTSLVRAITSNTFISKSLQNVAACQTLRDPYAPLRRPLFNPPRHSIVCNLTITKAPSVLTTDASENGTVIEFGRLKINPLERIRLHVRGPIAKH